MVIENKSNISLNFIGYWYFLNIHNSKVLTHKHSFIFSENGIS